MIQVDVHQNNDIIYMSINGRLDYHSVTTLRKILSHAVRERPRLLVLGLHKVNIMDSAALGLLIAVKNTLETIKGTLILCEMTHHVRRIFKTTKMMEYFTITPTKEDAFDYIKE